MGLPLPRPSDVRAHNSASLATGHRMHRARHVFPSPCYVRTDADRTGGFLTLMIAQSFTRMFVQFLLREADSGADANGQGTPEKA